VARDLRDVGLMLAEALIGEQEADERRIAVDEAELTAKFLPGFCRGHVTRTPTPLRCGRDLYNISLNNEIWCLPSTKYVHPLELRVNMSSD
jgi:hypothetical protein